MSRSTALFPLLTCATLGFAQSEKPLLLQKPAINRTHIVFTYAGDLWSVSVKAATPPGSPRASVPKPIPTFPPKYPNYRRRTASSARDAGSK
jgi:hypothetical protein